MDRICPNLHPLSLHPLNSKAELCLQAYSSMVYVQLLLHKKKYEQEQEICIPNPSSPNIMWQWCGSMLARSCQLKAKWKKKIENAKSIFQQCLISSEPIPLIDSALHCTYFQACCRHQIGKNNVILIQMICLINLQAFYP